MEAHGRSLCKRQILPVLRRGKTVLVSCRDSLTPFPTHPRGAFTRRGFGWTIPASATLPFPTGRSALNLDRPEACGAAQLARWSREKNGLAGTYCGPFGPFLAPLAIMLPTGPFGPFMARLAKT